MNARERRTDYPTFTVEEFRDRIRQLVGVQPQTKEDRPCVRTPEDRGYYPPTRKDTKQK